MSEITDIEKEVKFNRDEILKSKQFERVEIDILTALLEETQYSIEDCKRILSKESKRKVK